MSRKEIEKNFRRNTKCFMCGAELYRRPSDIEKNEKVYCSTACRNKYYVGEKNFVWKGGKRDRVRDTMMEKKRKTRYKLKAIEVMGGCCSSCGYKDCMAALDFHHVNPEEKDKDIKSLNQGTWEALEKEIKKCVLLCANCHRELHWRSGTGPKLVEEILREK